MSKASTRAIEHAASGQAFARPRTFPKTLSFVLQGLATALVLAVLAATATRHNSEYLLGPNTEPPRTGEIVQIGDITAP